MKFMPVVEGAILDSVKDIKGALQARSGRSMASTKLILSLELIDHAVGECFFLRRSVCSSLYLEARGDSEKAHNVVACFFVRSRTKKHGTLPRSRLDMCTSLRRL